MARPLPCGSPPLEVAGTVLHRIGLDWGPLPKHPAGQVTLLQVRFPRVVLAILVGAALATAGLFGVAHVPNPVLMPLALAWGLIACAVFLRWRNLYPLGVAHAILGICIAVSIPRTMDHNMRVGLGYLRYRAPVSVPKADVIAARVPRPYLPWRE